MSTKQTKPFWESSTLWINIAGIAVIVLDLVLQTDLVVDKDVVALLLAVLNILNRLRATTTPTKLTIK